MGEFVLAQDGSDIVAAFRLHSVINIENFP
jgi:hypothetical protein